MDRALEADPGNLEVLLSLGVSHTNELDASEALSYLHRWITAHPVHGPAAVAAPGPPDSSQRHAHVVGSSRCVVYYPCSLTENIPFSVLLLDFVVLHGHFELCTAADCEVNTQIQYPLCLQVGLFEAAARATPSDADALTALGVLHNLGRAYEPAVASFRCDLLHPLVGKAVL